MTDKNAPIETQLRPKSLKDYIGQNKIRQTLELFISAVHGRKTVAEHILLYGPPGIGKTTLAYILAHELKGDLKITSGPAIEKAGDLAAILTNLKDNDVLFIDEIHRLSKPIEEVLYPVMEEYNLDIVIGKGPSARTVRLSVPKITIIGATTRMALLSAPMRDRFGLILRLDFYEPNEMKKIIKRSADILELPLDANSISEISKRSRQTPRLANRILKRVRDIYQVRKHKIVNQEVIDNLFEILQIDSIGLGDLDVKYLRTLIDKFNGGPAGITTLATALAEDKQTLEDFIEPYLIQIGFIKKTGKGRVVTEKTLEHFKIKKPSDQLSLI